MKQAQQEGLESAIERLVQEHVAELHRTAAAAVARAFGQRLAARAARSTSATKRSAGSRRAPDEVAALAERLYTEVCASPGSAMSTLALQVGVSPRALNRPVMHLRRSGRLRSVGQRQGTRYFPMTGKASAKP